MSPAPSSPPTGLEAAFLANRETLLRFLGARGAGDAAEDLLQEIWLKIAGAPSGPVGNPLAYLHAVANRLMIDRYRSLRQAAQREQDWVEAGGGADPEASDAPSAERVLIGRDQLARVAQRLAALGPRIDRVFRRHRIDGVPQREVAAEEGVSLSTVEADLRVAYRAIAEMREDGDDA